MPAELNEITALGEQFRFVANLLQGVLAQGLEARAQLIRAHAVAQAAQFFDEVAQLRCHHIGGEVGMNFLRLGEAHHAIAQARENALC